MLAGAVLIGGSYFGSEVADEFRNARFNLGLSSSMPALDALFGAFQEAAETIDENADDAFAAGVVVALLGCGASLITLAK